VTKKSKSLAEEGDGAIHALKERPGGKEGGVHKEKEAQLYYGALKPKKKKVRPNNFDSVGILVGRTNRKNS